MDIEVGGRAKTLDEVTAPAVARSRFWPACLNRNVEIERWMIRNTGASDPGWTANRLRRGIGNDTTHWQLFGDPTFRKRQWTRPKLAVCGPRGANGIGARQLWSANACGAATVVTASPALGVEWSGKMPILALRKPPEAIGQWHPNKNALH